MTAFHHLLWISLVVASDLPQADEVAAVELLRLPEPASGVFAIYPEQGFSGVVISGSSFYRFQPGGEHELLKRVEHPTSLVQHMTGRLFVVDAAQPGVFSILRTPTTEGIRGRSMTRGTEERRLQRPASLLHDMHHATSNMGVGDVAFSTGRMYLSDSGHEDNDLPSGVIFYLVPSRTSPTGFETSVAADGLASPHGMALSKDRNTLYVVERKANRILAFPVTQPGRLGQPKVIAEFPVKETDAPSAVSRYAGLCLDHAGRLYVACEGAGVIQVLDPTTGRLLRSYDAGMRWPTAVAFNDRTSINPFDRLYVAGRTGSGDQPEGVVTYLELGVKGLKQTPATF
jgi:sugar lactone lactonase YvrE